MDGYTFDVYEACMASLKPASSLDHDILEDHLNKAGYQQGKFAPSLGKHNTCPVQLTLVVDDFGIK